MHEIIYESDFVILSLNKRINKAFWLIFHYSSILFAILCLIFLIKDFILLFGAFVGFLFAFLSVVPYAEFLQDKLILTSNNLIRIKERVFKLYNRKKDVFTIKEIHSIKYNEKKMILYSFNKKKISTFRIVDQNDHNIKEMKNLIRNLEMKRIKCEYVKYFN